MIIEKMKYIVVTLWCVHIYIWLQCRSARSLAGSETPPGQQYMKARSGPPVLEHHSDSSSEEEEENCTPPSPTQPRAIPRPVSALSNFIYSFFN